MSWFFPKRTLKPAESRQRLRLGVEPLESRTLLAGDLLAATDLMVAEKPLTTDGIVRTLDSTSAESMTLDDAIAQFAALSPEQLSQLDKGLQAVEMIAHLSDLLGMMADHLNEGAGLGFNLDFASGGMSASATAADLLAQLQKSMDGPNFSDLLKQVGPASPLPALPGDQMAQAQANLTKAFETVGAALEALGVRGVQFVMSGGSGAGGAWGAFVNVPGSSGDGWSFLLSIPGLQQQDATNLLDQWKPWADPTTSETVGWDPVEAAKDWAIGVAAFSTAGTIIGGRSGWGWGVRRVLR
jgi:hypothetical protein